MLRKIIKEAMLSGNLDLLCIVPHEEVENGIPFLSAKIRGRDTEIDKEREGWV
jgi:hypothetical protein